MRAETLRELDRSGADASRACVHQNGRAVPDAHLMVERDVRGQVRGEERSTGGIRRSVRQVEHPLRIDVDALGVTAGAPRQRNDAPPVELAGDLAAEYVRQLGHLRIEPSSNEDVREVDPRCANVNDVLAFCIGHFFECEVTAHLAEDDGLHRPVQLACRFSRNAATPSCPSSEVRHAANACTSRSSLRVSRVS